MKLKTIVGSCVAGACLLASMTLDAAVAVLELERSKDAKTWEKVVLDPKSLTLTGGVLQDGHDPHALYRLKINDDRNAGFVTALSLSNAPTQAVTIARQFIDGLLAEGTTPEERDPEGAWHGAQLGPVCYPIYDPTVENGKKPAYIEFKIVRAPQSSATPSPKDPFGMSPPTTTDDCDFGYLRVALTTNDFPVPSYSQGGATPVEMLLRKSRTSGPVKPMCYDEALLIGEDANGKIVGSIGNAPFSIDASILSIAGQEFEGREDTQGTQDDNAPSFPAKGYDSYEEFKADFLVNPLFRELRRLRAKSAQMQWNITLGIMPETIHVPLGVRTNILTDQQVQSVSVGDPQVATVFVPSIGSGLMVTGQEDSEVLLDVTYTNGATAFFVLVVDNGNENKALPKSAGWTAWSYWYAGDWGDQKRYSQYEDDPQMCPNGWSGCGPAAWAMLFGWWDYKGAERLIKSTTQADAPSVNDNSSVLECNRYTFDQMGPFCVAGQAATMPWNMKLGRYWANHRNAGREISWKWGLPYLSPGSVSKVADSIKAGRPAILGLGNYWHYPLAYGYMGRQWKLGNAVLDTERRFKCNMGWGGNSAEWHNANSTWFGTHARYW